jgi:hypothetical protein
MISPCCLCAYISSLIVDRQRVVCVSMCLRNFFFYVVRLVSNESRRLVIPRVFYYCYY